MSDKLIIEWNDFSENVLKAFKTLREDTDFADVTLACDDGRQVRAHKVILAASSPFFQNLLQRNTHPHPLIYMRKLHPTVMEAIVDFIYRGEANISQEYLEQFFAIAEELKIKGLMTDADVKQKKSMRTPIKSLTDPKVKEEKPKFPSQISDKSYDQNAFGQEFETEVKVAMSRKDSQDLDAKINSLMEKTERKTTIGGYLLYQCKVCGKESPNANMKHHIEQNHIEGVSLPCNQCEKVFRSRKILAQHIASHNKI